jgi:hypothetical protein
MVRPMRRSQTTSIFSVREGGAKAGAYLRGCGMNNQGLRLHIHEEQMPGKDGPITGPFMIVDAGENKYSLALKPFLHQVTNAAELLKVLRSHSPIFLHVANMNILTVEAAEKPPDQGAPEPKERWLRSFLTD